MPEYEKVSLDLAMIMTPRVLLRTWLKAKDALFVTKFYG